MTLSPFEDSDSAISLLSTPSEWAEERGKSHDPQLQLSRTSRHRAITTLFPPKPRFVLPTAKMFRTAPRMAGYVEFDVFQLPFTPNCRARARPISASKFWGVAARDCVNCHCN